MIVLTSFSSWFTDKSMLWKDQLKFSRDLLSRSCKYVVSMTFSMCVLSEYLYVHFLPCTAIICSYNCVSVILTRVIEHLSRLFSTEQQQQQIPSFEADSVKPVCCRGAWENAELGQGTGRWLRSAQWKKRFVLDFNQYQPGFWSHPVLNFLMHTSFEVFECPSKVTHF